MKRFTLIAGVLLGAVVLAGCVNEGFEKTKKGTPITLTAGIENDNATRTDFTDPANPIWSEGDAIGVQFVNDEGQTVQRELTGTFSPDYITATFAGTLDGLVVGANTLYGYYPYSASLQATGATIAEFNVPATQHPTATSFDPNADIMVMKPFTFNYDGVTPINENGMQFSRRLSMIKLSLTSSDEAFRGEAITNLTFTTAGETDLAAQWTEINLVNGAIESVAGTSKTITVEPNGDILANGTDVMWLCVLPSPFGGFANGDEVTIEGVSEGYKFTKTVTIPADIEMTAGNWLPLNINLDGCITEKAPDVMPGENQWAYEGQLYDFGGANYYADYEGEGISYLELVGTTNFKSIDIFVPMDMLDGQTIDLMDPAVQGAWQFVYYFSDISWEMVQADPGGDMISGTINATLDRDAETLAITGHIVYAGNIHLRINYSGAIDGIPVIGEDVMPGANQYAYNGEVFDLATPRYNATYEESAGIGYFEMLGTRSAYESVDLFLPISTFDGITRDLMSDPEMDGWEIVYYYSPTTWIDIQSDPGGNMTAGTVSVSVDRTAKTVEMVAHFVYNDAINLRINYSGPITGLPNPPDTYEPYIISSIDELVGTWNVMERNIDYGTMQVGPVSYPVQITKIDETNIRISNLMNRSSVVNASINENMEFDLGLHPEITPTWNSTVTTHIVPLTTAAQPFAEAWLTPFTPVGFLKGTNSGSLRIVLATTSDDVTALGDYVNYYVAANVLGTNYESPSWFSRMVANSVWTKETTPSAAPARVQANTNYSMPVAKAEKFDMRITPMPVSKQRVKATEKVAPVAKDWRNFKK